MKKLKISQLAPGIRYLQTLALNTSVFGNHFIIFTGNNYIIIKGDLQTELVQER